MGTSQAFQLLDIGPLPPGIGLSPDMLELIKAGIFPVAQKGEKAGEIYLAKAHLHAPRGICELNDLDDIPVTLHLFKHVFTGGVAMGGIEEQPHGGMIGLAHHTRRLFDPVKQGIWQSRGGQSFDA